MKRYAYFLLLAFFPLFFTSCELIDDAGLTNEEVIEGLREALTIGSETSTQKAALPNGYFGDERIKILFPEEAAIVESTVRAIPFVGNQACDLAIQKMNEAAEDAAPQATQIFVDAVAGITIEDGFAILNGNDDAATEYLKTNTFNDLYGLFKPHIETSLNSVGAQQAWTSVTDYYNSVPFVDPVNTDLADHTTNKALDGLFVLVADEELKIRQDASARITAILQKVFGSLDN